MLGRCEDLARFVVDEIDRIRHDRVRIKRETRLRHRHREIGLHMHDDDNLVELRRIRREMAFGEAQTTDAKQTDAGTQFDRFEPGGQDLFDRIHPDFPGAEDMPDQPPIYDHRQAGNGIEVL